MLKVKLVDSTHQRELLGIWLDRFVVQARSIHAQKLALPAHRHPASASTNA
jgi:hypothetical protein